MSAPRVYTLLIYSSRSPDAPLSAEQEEAMLEQHRALQTEASARGELLAVARLDASAGGPSAHGAGGRTEMIDGPYIETKEWLVGFYLLECASEEEAIERAKMICPIADHAIEV
ncbi:MAG: hypothetical protein KDK70_40005, partial [Myxococcales bacterium]|nr:hypothetical protein [Myxococcales bacterium]